MSVTASAEGIIRTALARVPRNYPVRPTQLTGFYRESDDDAASGRYDYLAEGQLLVYKPSYQRPRAAGYVQVRESRRVDLRADSATRLSLPGINWMAGALVPTASTSCSSARRSLTPGTSRVSVPLQPANQLPGAGGIRHHVRAPAG
ncbi:MAG: hypothetical protein WKG07_06110 [Hymenobacter sp.]